MINDSARIRADIKNDLELITGEKALRYFDQHTHESKLSNHDESSTSKEKKWQPVRFCSFE